MCREGQLLLQPCRDEELGRTLAGSLCVVQKQNRQTQCAAAGSPPESFGGSSLQVHCNTNKVGGHYKKDTSCVSVTLNHTETVPFSLQKAELSHEVAAASYQSSVTNLDKASLNHTAHDCTKICPTAQNGSSCC